ncbi:glycosyltransferase family 4 protein [Candidatus Woesearchaeota archaeon]|nr:glycosyltransferase family 4 protein [Candidatus Woesearchaeota archaeon]MBT4368857.1 glycosyltransferase family 4 protein [Candidatus Woesearchaeota archaeon]MBT4712146.1 glycosyltransferase family 4 protein [Candidatus Woesearchaeota archaeon]MBT6639106.1 glycosyltransferase family 4 protein [Candidatus Woesearchaeota archaeon]MBT7134306.1 glycosyltransferase family 4 protein [Candidatus Woesearchaeota archaeon]
MKIALITAFYDEREKGNEYYLADNLTKLGHEITIYVSKFSVPRYGKVRKITEGSKLKNVRVIRLNSCGIKRKGMLKLRGLKKKIEKENFDAIHLQEWFMPMGWQLRKLKNLVLTQRIEKIPTIIKIAYHLYGKKLLRNAKTVTTLTTQAKNELEKLGIKREIKVISNGVDTELFSPKKHTKSEKLRILYVGRLSKEKGINKLITACSKLNYDYCLKIIGSGDKEMQLKKLANDSKINCEFLGKKPQSELPNYYSEADVLVIPSLKEPFGFVTLEALSCGTPVIGSNIGGMRDVIDNTVGIKVKPGSLAELVNALKEMQKKAEGLRKKCREYIIKNYSWTVVAKKYSEAYK